MTRIVHLLAQLAVVAVPALGWFLDDWSGATTLAVYWFETTAGCVFIAARIALHRRWTPRRGHFRYEGAGAANARAAQPSSFLSSFAIIAFAFSAAHAVFLAVVLLLLHRVGSATGLTALDWHSVGTGCAVVFGLLALDFAVDLLSLRRWSFWQLEQVTNSAFSRVMVVHATLLVGFIGIAVTGASDALFGIFVVLKTLAALSAALPQWEPAVAPKWLSRLMNRVPNVEPGESFEEYWAKDRADEAARRLHNEEPWTGR